MTITPRITRRLGTMITYGFIENGAEADLGLARRMNAQCVEILPHWRKFPDPSRLRNLVADHGLTVHSAHGCWGGQSILARRVDLGSLHLPTRQESMDDIRRCLDWIAEASGKYLVIHPGGISSPSEKPGRRSALLDSLQQLADHAGAVQVTLCVENMPPGVHPGSLMADLTSLVIEIGRPEIAIALDTGHAHLGGLVGEETQATRSFLKTTHVHDNHGKHDVHLPPGHGTIDWRIWIEALDAISYNGPIILECIRYIRDNPESLTPEFIEFLQTLTTSV